MKNFFSSLFGPTSEPAQQPLFPPSRARPTSSLLFPASAHSPASQLARRRPRGPAPPRGPAGAPSARPALFWPARAPASTRPHRISPLCVACSAFSAHAPTPPFLLSLCPGPRQPRPLPFPFFPAPLSFRRPPMALPSSASRRSRAYLESAKISPECPVPFLVRRSPPTYKAPAEPRLLPFPSMVELKHPPPPPQFVASVLQSTPPMMS